MSMEEMASGSSYFRPSHFGTLSPGKLLISILFSYFPDFVMLFLLERSPLFDFLCHYELGEITT